MTLIEFAILAAACWRLSSMLAREDGPWAVFDALRKKAGVWYNEDGIPQGREAGDFASGLVCQWCSSIWFGAFFAVFWALAPRAAVLVALPFALSAAAIAWEKLAT